MPDASRSRNWQFPYVLLEWRRVRVYGCGLVYSDSDRVPSITYDIEICRYGTLFALVTLFCDIWMTTREGFFCIFSGSALCASHYYFTIQAYLMIYLFRNIELSQNERSLTESTHAHRELFLMKYIIYSSNQFSLTIDFLQNEKYPHYINSPIYHSLC